MEVNVVGMGIVDEFKDEFDTLVEYERELEKDLELNKDIPSMEAKIIENKQKLAKWMSRKSYHRLNLSKYNSSYIDVDANIRLEKKIIRSEMAVVMVDREINKLIVSDDRLQDIQYAIDYLEVLINFCDSAEKALNGQSFDLQKLIELTFYQQGYSK